MSGRGRSAKDFVPVKEYFPDEESVKEEPKSVEILAQALSNLTIEFSLVRKENDQLRKELERFKELEQLSKEKPKKKVNKVRDYDLFIKNKITELKSIHEGLKYMELRTLANNEWKTLKETMSTASSQNSSASNEGN